MTTRSFEEVTKRVLFQDAAGGWWERITRKESLDPANEGKVREFLHGKSVDYYKPADLAKSKPQPAQTASAPSAST